MLSERFFGFRCGVLRWYWYLRWRWSIMLLDDSDNNIRPFLDVFVIEFASNDTLILWWWGWYVRSILFIVILCATIVAKCCARCFWCNLSEYLVLFATAIYFCSQFQTCFTDQRKLSKMRLKENHSLLGSGEEHGLARSRLTGDLSLCSMGVSSNMTAGIFLTELSEIEKPFGDSVIPTDVSTIFIQSKK